jgi:hypothetical protein
MSPKVGAAIGLPSSGEDSGKQAVAPKSRAVRESRAGGAGHRFWRRIVDLLVIALLMAAAVVPLQPVFGGQAVVVPVLTAIVAGLLVAAVTSWRRAHVLIMLAAAVVVYLVTAPAVVVPSMTTQHVVPTDKALTWLGSGLFTVWQRVLTIATPIGPDGGFLLAAYLVAFVGTVVAAGLALRDSARLAAWALLPPAACLLVAIVLGTKTTVLPVVLGIVCAAVALTWLAWRRGTLAGRRLPALVAVIAVMAAAGWAGGTFVAPLRDRYVVRDHVQPPFNPEDYASPLSSFRRYVKKLKNTDLLEVKDLPRNQTIRIATMDDFDGIVWNVAGGSGMEDSGEFRRVGRTIPGSMRSDGGQSGGTTSEVSLKVLDSSTKDLTDGAPNVWLYSTGYARKIQFNGTDATAAATGLRYNSATGGLVEESGVPGDVHYDVETYYPPGSSKVGTTEDSCPDLGGAQAANITLPDIDRSQMQTVMDKAREIVGTDTTASTVAKKLCDNLQTRGYFSNGQEGDADAGDISIGSNAVLSGHGLDRINQLLTAQQMRGDDEQYASAMALMAQVEGLPARVVMGFAPYHVQQQAALDPKNAGDLMTPSTDKVLKGKDIQAWVEIDFDGYGWVPFFPTPYQDQTPTQTNTGNSNQPQPQVVQPPPPTAKHTNPPDDKRQQPNTSHAPKAHPTKKAAPVGKYAVWTAGGLGALIVVTAPFWLVLLLKLVRRRRRSRHGPPLRRISNGWRETMDLVADLHVDPPPLATRVEAARHAVESGVLGEDVAAAAPVGLLTLAADADQAIFGGAEPSDAAAGAYWEQIGQVRAGTLKRMKRRSRLRARLSPRSLRRRHGWRGDAQVRQADEAERKAEARAAKRARKGARKGGSGSGNATGAAGAAGESSAGLPIPAGAVTGTLPPVTRRPR